jgi:hypothetical protein
MFERTGVSVEKRRLERLSLVCSHLAGTKMEDDMFQSRLGVRFVAVIALSLSIMAISAERSEAGEKELCPCLFDPAFWTQAAFMDELNSKARAEENCSKVTLDRSSRMTLNLVGSKPLGLGMALEVSRDMATDGFKAYSECKVSWTVTGSAGEGAAINFNEEILFDVTHYEVIAEPTSPYKDLISAMPSMNAGPV